MKTISIYNNFLKHNQLKREQLEHRIKNKGFNTGRDGEYIFVLGGDGTFLRAIQRNFYKKPTPTFIGINTGNLGFLSEFSFQDTNRILEMIIKDTYDIERVPLYQIDIHFTSNRKRRLHFLNDISFEREGTKIIHCGVKVNNKKLGNFSGDGVIISTPIGSTGYAMSAKGAIAYDCKEHLQLTPSNPIISKAYQSITNSILFNDKNTLEIFPNTKKKRRIRVVVDGREISEGDISKVVISKSPKTVSFLRSDKFDRFANFKNKILAHF